jgi:tetratricopeptide (TPR) repeat protein
MNTNDDQLKQLREVYKANPGSIDAALKLAQGYSDQGWYNEAIEIYKEVMQKHPADFTLLLEYGNICFRRKEYNEAIGAFRKLTEIKPERMEGWNNLGIVQLSIDKQAEARGSFAKVLEIEPDNPGALLNMGNCCQAGGEKEKAIELFEHAVKSRLDFPDGWFNLGNAYLSIGNFEKAKFAYEKALRYQREFPSAMKNLGYACEQSGDYKNAERYYLEASELNKGDAALQVNLANIYLRSDRYEEAKKSFLKAVRLAPRETAGWLGLRHLALLKGDIPTYVRATLAILPRLDEDSVAKSVEILRELEHIDEAADLVAQTDRLDKKGDELDAQRLVIYQLKKLNPGKIIALNKKLSSLQQPSDSIIKCLGLYAYETGAFDTAVRILRQVKDPGLPALKILWRAQIANGDKKGVEESLRAFLDPHQDCYDAWFLLATLELEKGHRGAAFECLKKAVENGFTEMEELKSNPDLESLFRSISKN